MDEWCSQQGFAFSPFHAFSSQRIGREVCHIREHCVVETKLVTPF